MCKLHTYSAFVFWIFPRALSVRTTPWVRR